MLVYAISKKYSNKRVMPAKYKSASVVRAFLVFRPATQKLSLKWLMDFSTVMRVLYVLSHSSVPQTVPELSEELYRNATLKTFYFIGLCGLAIN